VARCDILVVVLMLSKYTYYILNKKINFSLFFSTDWALSRHGWQATFLFFDLMSKNVNDDSTFS